MTRKSQEVNKVAGKHGLKSEYWMEASGLKQQVQRLTKEIAYKTQAILQITAKYETTIAYLVNELKSLTSPSINKKNELAKLEEIENAVMHWISDMRSLANTHKTNEFQPNHLQKRLPHNAYPFQQSDCQSLTLDYEALQAHTNQPERVSTQNMIASQQLGYLQAEVRRHQISSAQLLPGGQQWKEQAITLSGQLTQNQVELRRIMQQNNGLRHINRQLTIQLEASKQQLGQASSKLQSLKRENKRLADQHRQSVRSQQALNSIIAENQREIQKICTEAYKLKLQIHGFQLKFKEIVENEEKQKAQEMLKPKKQEQKVTLCEVPTQNTIDSLQSKSSKLDAARLIKINLQFYQEKLMNLSSAASIYLS